MKARNKKRVRRRKIKVKSLKKHIEDEDNLKEFEEDLLAPEESADESETKEENK